MTQPQRGFAASIACLFLVLGCGEGQPSTPTAAEQPTAATEQPTTPTKTGDKPAPGGRDGITKIVFVGQKNACDCTRKRIDASWDNLVVALTKHESIEVEQIALDVDSQRYDELDDLKSLLVAPGLYFFDAKGQLVEMLQGEVDATKITALLK